MAGANAVRAGKAYVELFVKKSTVIPDTLKELESFSKKAAQYAKVDILITASFWYPIKDILKDFVKFDDTMRVTGAVTQATGKDFQQLTRLARELGATTSFTASQVSEGMAALGRSGFSSSEIQGIIGNFLDLSRATDTDLARSVQIASTVIRGFNMDASDSKHVVDVLTAAANGSSQTLEDLGNAYKYVASVTKLGNVSFEESAKALAFLANQGIRGTLAATTLRNIIIRKSDPKVIKEYEALGVQVEDTEGNLRSLADVMREVFEQTKYVPQVEVLARMNKMFSKFAIAGGASLAGVSNYEELFKFIDEADGRANEVAQNMDAGIGGRIRIALSEFQDMLLTLGDTVTPVVDEALAEVGVFTSKFGAFFDKNRQTINDFLRVFAGIASTALNFVGGFAKLAVAFAPLTKVIIILKAFKTATALAVLSFNNLVKSARTVSVVLMKVGQGFSTAVFGATDFVAKLLGIETISDRIKNAEKAIESSKNAVSKWFEKNANLRKAKEKASAVAAGGQQKVDRAYDARKQAVLDLLNQRKNVQAAKQGVANAQKEIDAYKQLVKAHTEKEREFKRLTSLYNSRKFASQAREYQLTAESLALMNDAVSKQGKATYAQANMSSEQAIVDAQKKRQRRLVSARAVYAQFIADSVNGRDVDKEAMHAAYGELKDAEANVLKHKNRADTATKNIAQFKQDIKAYEAAAKKVKDKSAELAKVRAAWAQQEKQLLADIQRADIERKGAEAAASRQFYRAEKARNDINEFKKEFKEYRRLQKEARKKDAAYQQAVKDRDANNAKAQLDVQNAKAERDKARAAAKAQLAQAKAAKSQLSIISALRSGIAVFGAAAVALTALAVAYNLVHVAQKRFEGSINRQKERLENKKSELDEKQSQDTDALEKLEEYSKKSKLNNVEIQDAQRLIELLSDRYGELGLSIDTATGKLEGFENAQSKVNEQMKQAQRNLLVSQMANKKRELEYLERQRREKASDEKGFKRFSYGKNKWLNALAISSWGVEGYLAGALLTGEKGKIGAVLRDYMGMAKDTGAEIGIGEGTKGELSELDSKIAALRAELEVDKVKLSNLTAENAKARQKSEGNPIQAGLVAEGENKSLFEQMFGAVSNAVPVQDTYDQYIGNLEVQRKGEYAQAIERLTKEVGKKGINNEILEKLNSELDSKFAPLEAAASIWKETQEAKAAQSEQMGGLYASLHEAVLNLANATAKGAAKQPYQDEIDRINKEIADQTLKNAQVNSELAKKAYDNALAQLKQAKEGGDGVEIASAEERLAKAISNMDSSTSELTNALEKAGDKIGDPLTRLSSVGTFNNLEALDMATGSNALLEEERRQRRTIEKVYSTVSKIQAYYDTENGEYI